MKVRSAIDVAYGSPLIIDEIDLPPPRPDQLIVKLFSSGLCHTQLHWLQNQSGSRPRISGHEATGVVTDLGSDVTHVKEGDHVIVTWTPRLSLRDTPSHPGVEITFRGEPLHTGSVYTWAEAVLVHHAYVVPIAKADPTDLSCIVGCAVMTGAGAVLHTANVRPTDSVAIYGAGGVGLSAVRMAAILGADPIIVVDLDNAKLALAKEFGATHTINANIADPVASIVEISNGGVDFAFDAIGVPKTVQQLLPSTRRGRSRADGQGGVAVLVGLPMEEITLDLQQLLMGHRCLRSSLGASHPERDFAMFLRWHQEGKFPLDKLVTRRYQLEEINEGYAALAAGEILGRAIIEF
jgi:Zn-dependent alcohol dehydrogenase